MEFFVHECDEVCLWCASANSCTSPDHDFSFNFGKFNNLLIIFKKDPELMKSDIT